MMVWAKLEDTYGDDCAPLSDAAFRTHTEGLCWTMRRLTEGRITERDLRRFAETSDPDAAVAELVHCDWWQERPGGGWLIVRDMDYQRTREQVEADRAANADRQRRWREARAKKKRSAAKEDSPLREDVERLCRHLADRIEANGSKRPNITKTWRDEARLLLDADGRTEAQVIAAIDWCQGNAFWRRVVLSMPKLREKYDQLRMAAEDERKQRAGANGTAMRGGARQPVLTPEETATLTPESVV